MNETTDMTALTIRVGILLVIVGIFYIILKSKKN